MSEVSDHRNSAEQSESELQKHKLWEYIEERLDKRTARSRSTFVFAIALLGLIGIPSLFFVLKASVVDKVASDIREQTKILTERVTKNLTTLETTISGLEAQIEKGRQLENELDAHTKTAKSLVEDLAKSTTQAVALMKTSEETLRRVEGLRDETEQKLDELKSTLDVRLDRIIANTLGLMQTQFQQRLKEFAEQLSQELDKPQIATIEPPIPVSAKEGWVYLGHFEDGSWATQYLDFDKGDTPSSLVKTPPVVRVVRKETGALNVREGMPGPDGKFPDVIDVLKVESEVEILEVSEWYSSGYMWARIKYKGR